MIYSIWKWIKFHLNLETWYAKNLTEHILIEFVKMVHLHVQINMEKQSVKNSSMALFPRLTQ